jgi:parallel beta-helix repeat protein
VDPRLRRRKPATVLALLVVLPLGAAVGLPGGTASASSCPINVANFGHSLSAAQRALHSVTSSCRTLVFPAGTYSFKDQFRIGSGSVKVTGRPGAVIKPAAGSSWRGGMIQIAASHVTVSGLTLVSSRDKGIEANRANNFTISGNSVSASHTMGIHILRSSGGTISGNRIFKNRSNGVDLHGATNVAITNNKSYLNGAQRFPERNEGNGILVYCSQWVQVLNNTVWDNSQTQPGSRDGIRLSDNNTQSGEMPTRHIVVDGNLIYDNQSRGTQNYAIRIGAPDASSRGGDLNYITVRNNTGYGNLNGGTFTAGLARGATYTIANNKLTAR